MSRIIQPTPLRDKVPLPAIALFALWAIQLRFPPLAYPAIGLLVMVALGGGVMLAILRVFPTLKAVAGARILVPILLFIAWVTIRWATQGFSAWGAEIVGTWLWAGAWMIAGWLAVQRDSLTENKPAQGNAVWGTVWLFALAGTLCGFHGIYQYFIGYDAARRELINSMGGRTPSLTEMGILYHLELKRVASVLGDPNSLATLAALGLCGWFEIAITFKRWGLRLLSALGIAGCLAGVWLSGSRGGVLDVFTVLLLYGAFLLLNKKLALRGPVRTGIHLLLLVPMTLAIAGNNMTSAQETAPQPKGWASRSNTVQERLYYADAGLKMIEMAPLTGLGPGSVERYFGRLKQPEARETKFLHNWILQIWSEFGIIGFGLISWWLGALIISARRFHFWQSPGLRALCIMMLVFILDGLIQVSWNQRELMSAFGLISGIIAGNSNPCPTGDKIRLGWRVAFLLPPLAFLSAETLYLSGKNYKQMAVDAMSIGDNVTATRLWKKAGQWVPRDPDIPAALATIQLGRGDTSGAADLLEQALKMAPESASLNAQAGQVAIQANHTAKAQQYLTKALQLYPSKPEYNYLMAGLLADLGNPQTALYYARTAQKYNYMKEDADRYRSLVNSLETKTSGTLHD